MSANLLSDHDPEDALARFGPMGEHVVAFIDATNSLSAPQVLSIANAWHATQRSTWGTALVAIGAVMTGNNRDAAGDAVWVTSRNNLSITMPYSAWATATDAAWALVVFDLITHDHDRREACEALLAPVRAVPALNAIIDQAWEHAENIAKRN